jgi:rsbT co-antagonist protein RsbR
MTEDISLKRDGDAIQEDASALRAEIAALKARIAELETEAARRKPQGKDDLGLQNSGELLRAILDNSTAVIFVKDPDGRYLLTNRRFENLFHMTREQILGKTDYEIIPAEIADRVRANDQAVIAANGPIEIEEVVPSDDEPHTYISIKFPIYDANGALLAVCGMATEITDRKRAEEERAALQQQIISAQETALRELSTPLIPLAEGVLAMPLVGSIDSARAAQIMEALLDGIGAARARIAILDITGVKVVDSQVANALIRAAKAARLLGAEVILTGIGPAVAMSLVQLEADLSNVMTLSTLQAGIAYAMSRG